MSTELAVRQLTPTVWQTIQAVAPSMHQSRLFGVTNPEQACVIMLKGFELGLGLAASFEFVQVVMGKPALSPKGALALIHRSGELAGMKIEDKPDSCTVTMKRKGGFEYTLTYTLEDAKRAGLVKPGSAWEAYGPNMLRWRCIGFVADVVFPDILGGLKRADEFGAAIDVAGNVVEGEWTVPEPPEPPKYTGPTLDQLVERYGADQVLAAAGGKIPGTSEEVAAVAATLVARNATN